MIKYEGGEFHALLLLRSFGSVLPFVLSIALPCALAGAGLQAMARAGLLERLELLENAAAYAGFTGLVGFFLVFRTQQAYSRFLAAFSAVKHMRGRWFDAASSLIAYCNSSTSAELAAVLTFQHTLLRLFSLLHACALAKLESEDEEESTLSHHRAFELPLVDAKGLDRESLLAILRSSSKVELLYHWIQQLVVENIQANVLDIHPAILSRSFHELGNGMVGFQNALVVASVPFPFPYMQTTEVLLILHWLVTPLVTMQWTHSPVWAFSFCFLSMLCLWSLNSIACQMEDPFGEGANHLDGQDAQATFNKHLLLLIRPSTIRTPTLSRSAVLEEGLHDEAMISFSDVWKKIAGKVKRGTIRPMDSRITWCGVELAEATQRRLVSEGATRTAAMLEKKQGAGRNSRRASSCGGSTGNRRRRCRGRSSSVDGHGGSATGQPASSEVAIAQKVRRRRKEGWW